MGWSAGRGLALTSLGRELALPPFVLLDAEFLAILVPIPDQQLTARPDHPAGSVEDLPVILQGHQVLLLVIPGTVHIPGVKAGKGKETTGDPSTTGHQSLQALRPPWFPLPPMGTFCSHIRPGCVNSYFQILFPVLFLAGMLFSPYLISHCPEPSSRLVSTWTVRKTGDLQLL